MVQIKLLDEPPFYYHQYETELKMKKQISWEKRDLIPERDAEGNILFDGPYKDWLLPYKPAYIFTDEQWLVDRLTEYAKTAHEMVDIISDKPWAFTCSIPQHLISMCVRPDEVCSANELPEIKVKSDEVTVTSDGRVYYHNKYTVKYEQSILEKLDEMHFAFEEE